MTEDRTRKTRWRLIFGAGTGSAFGEGNDDLSDQQDKALGFLYDREYGKGRNVRNKAAREGGLGESQLNVVDWINSVHELFPQKTIERIEKDALERYQLEEMMTNPEFLNRAQPSESLLKAVLRTKTLMNQEVLAAAGILIEKVVQQLMEKLARKIEAPFYGVRNRRQRSFLKIANNFDAKETIRRNLKNYDTASKRLVIDTPFFFSRVRRQVDQWQLIILVDQSGSMAGSVIHAAITAAIFCGLKSLRTHLIAFDTSVVDLTPVCHNAVETLMSVQLGGGTDIGKALAYSATLINNPRSTIVVLISDFEEGAPPWQMLTTVKQMVESGVNFLGLAALDSQAKPYYSLDMASRLVDLGAHVAAMTPGELATWIAEKVR